jgi:hypothetical protein
MEQIKYWVALGLVRLLGTVRFRRSEDFFGETENVWQASLIANSNFWGNLTMNRYTLMIFDGLPAYPSLKSADC